MNEIPVRLVLEDSSEFECFAFGYPKSVSNEEVFRAPLKTDEWVRLPGRRQVGHRLRDNNPTSGRSTAVILPLHGGPQPHAYAGCLLSATVSIKNRWKLYVRFFNPILARARTRPIVRMSLPPIAVT
jgi:hypothetical protein